MCVWGGALRSAEPALNRPRAQPKTEFPAQAFRVSFVCSLLSGWAFTCPSHRHHLSFGLYLMVPRLKSGPHMCQASALPQSHFPNSFLSFVIGLFPCNLNESGLFPGASAYPNVSGWAELKQSHNYCIQKQALRSWSQSFQYKRIGLYLKRN